LKEQKYCIFQTFHTCPRKLLANEDQNITCQYVKCNYKNIMFYNLCPKNAPFWPKSGFWLFLRISIRFLRYSRPQYRILTMSHDVICYLKMALSYDGLSQTFLFLIFSTFKNVKKCQKCLPGNAILQKKHFQKLTKPLLPEPGRSWLSKSGFGSLRQFFGYKCSNH
jgi:hypothetical protein